jgi:endonuclease YncB( thermonuclease family)
VRWQVQANQPDRIVAQGFLDKADVAEEMVKSHTACDWPKFSGGHYKLDEAVCSQR